MSKNNLKFTSKYKVQDDVFKLLVLFDQQSKTQKYFIQSAKYQGILFLKSCN